MVERPLLFFGADKRQRRVSAHTTGVGAFVVVIGALVVLAEGHGVDAVVVDESHEGELGANQVVFDDDFAFAEGFSHEHVAESAVGFGFILRNDYALACCQSVVLEDGGIGATRADIGEGFVIVREAAVGGCRDVVAGHEFLGELLARLNLRGSLGVPEDGYAGGAESVYDTCGQTGFRADDAEVDVLLLSKGEEGGNVGVGNGYTLGQVCYAGVAGGTKDVTHLRAAAELVDDGVLASAGSYDKYFLHQCLKWRMPVKSMAMWWLLAASMLSASRTLPPG